MSSIPATTQPLTKFIRTGEGALVFAFNGVLLVVPIVSNALTPEQAVQWAAILNGVAVVSRTGLKVVSLLEGATNPAPAPPAANLEPADSPHAPIGAGVGDDEEFASVPPSVEAAPGATQAAISFAPADPAPNGQPATSGWA